MNLTRIGMTSLAAAIALAGCDGSNDTVGVLSTPISITPENAPAVAAQGNDMIQGSTSPNSVVDSAMPMSIDAGSSAAGGIKQAMTLGQIAAIVRSHLEAAGAGDVTGLPVSVVVSDPVTYDCDGGGTYTVTETASSYDLVYNGCTYSYSEPGYSQTYSWDGRITGTYAYGGYGGNYTYVYDGFRSRYNYTYNGQRSYGNWALDGTYFSTQTGPQSYNYGASGLQITYDYSYTESESGGPVAARGNVIYDTYNFDWSFDGELGAYTWSGMLSARDSTYGQWGIWTPSPWSVDYCNGEVNGEVVYSGMLEEEGRSGGAGNSLHTVGDGTNMVRYDLYGPSGNLISSRTQDWFPYDYGCYK